jgi:c(7)-type cytochrome triheme protein
LNTIRKISWLSWRLALLILLTASIGAAMAAENVQLAILMAAPNIPPPKPLPSSSVAVGELHPARRAIELNPIYDETNPSYLRLQRIDEATQNLKRDSLGFPDWMASIRSGAITPRANLSADGKMNVLDLDVVMKNTKEMPYVLFPHQSHTLWLDCSNCHPALFTPKAGSNPVSMTEIFRGKYCGVCHDRVAFITFFACTRCHSVARDNPAPKK